MKERSLDVFKPGMIVHPILGEFLAPPFLPPPFPRCFLLFPNMFLPSPICLSISSSPSNTPRGESSLPLRPIADHSCQRNLTVCYYFYSQLKLTINPSSKGEAYPNGKGDDLGVAIDKLLGDQLMREHEHVEQT
jgi:hypothetical protein